MKTNQTQAQIQTEAQPQSLKSLTTNQDTITVASQQIPTTVSVSTTDVSADTTRNEITMLPDSTNFSGGSKLLTRASQRFVVRRGNNDTPQSVIAASKDELMNRLTQEVIQGQVLEVHVYEYVGTVRQVKTAEVVNIFTEDENDGKS